MNPVARLFHKLLVWRHRHFVATGNPFRERRLRFFLKHIDHEGENILDVGYGYGQFENQLVELGVRNSVIALDIVPRDVSRHPNVIALVAADAASLPFADRSIDIIYCNSLLEHVGDWHVQRRVFAAIERVGRKLFVQTPNRHFPLEPHHLLPFFQYWPRPVQRWVGENILGHYEQVWLLDRKAVEELAGSSAGIVVWEEKTLGLTKSFVLYRR
jgi:SAM-dependent methyltransferase